MESDIVITTKTKDNQDENIFSKTISRVINFLTQVQENSSTSNEMKTTETDENSKMKQQAKVDWNKIGLYLCSVGKTMQELSIVDKIPDLDVFEQILAKIEENNSDTEENGNLKISHGDKDEAKFQMNEKRLNSLQNSNDMFDYIEFVNYQIEHQLSTEARFAVFVGLSTAISFDNIQTGLSFYEVVIGYLQHGFWWQKQEVTRNVHELNLCHASKMNSECVLYLLNLLESKSDSIVLKKAIYSLFDNIKLCTVPENLRYTKGGQFCIYLSSFIGVTNDTNNNRETKIINTVQNLLRNLMFNIAAFVSVSNDTTHHDKNFLEAAEKLGDLQLIDPCCIVPENHMTAYHIAAMSGNIRLFNILLSVDNDSGKYKTKKQTKTPKDLAFESGHWHVYEKIIFAQKGSKIKDKVTKERNRLDLIRGTVYKFLQVTDEKDDKDSNNVNGMENLLSDMINLIENRQPLSDDMLLASWHYEIRTKKLQDKTQSRLWIAIENALNQVLSLPLSKIEFVWFKSYLFRSSIWYENVYDSESVKNTDKQDYILYDKLIEIVNKQLKTQKAHLKVNINKLLDSKNEAFDKIIKFEEHCVVDLSKTSLRQDDSRVLKYPNPPLFFENELKEFGLKGIYETNAYLTQLIFQAHLFNDSFHNVMRSTILKDIKTANYRVGPVKRIERCQV